ncbi:Iron only hydrogenase large subunit, C-terminal domain containing protein [Trichomonas vaginalis G3]|uniref:Iron only hydrogenase large subunit, C-terminal domain containing protein n=1 Tax=Trichomonas vaginalis (strain ATCC PRA-98 / G3) TaxID=412133 RepID=A2DRY8_TRIV3|nr:iron-sulfur cluster assembly [Trichomonas vaginalis G3]EAY16758.1 Iron only hydrogenase large subunit, C-terminal domain containing protein [Trichomonas vaginalis G3]KAI5490835.1 iron-sulfur cluster assembly [Trichomonas vaginalis G3]|eukprot:XP_001328981.1 Iron only hydrogenase large subunit, C-terminal domain containing protein [Trichomonas vaginalis G3]
MLSIKIDGKEYQEKKGQTILQVCNKHGVYIPTLCNHPDLPPIAHCGVCVVKINGNNFVLSCSHKIAAGMEIETGTPEIKAKALDALQNFSDVTMMPKTPEIEELYTYLKPARKVNMTPQKLTSISFDPGLCIQCDRCTRACSDIQAMDAIQEDTHQIIDFDCIQCGQCANVCPTNAIYETPAIPKVIQALAKGYIMIMQFAPSVRVTMGEMFGDEPGTICTGKIIAASRMMGFRYVFDIAYGADITVLEEGAELVHKIQNNEKLPMFTSCCPSWVNFVERKHPELIPQLSTAKSPHMMSAAAIKTVFADVNNIDPSKIFLVSMMPCTAKKDEIIRTPLQGQVDAVITAREFGQMIKTFDIDWSTLDSDHTAAFDKMMGESSGGGNIFGVSGGVMESTMRYVSEKLTGQTLVSPPDFRQISEEMRSAEVQIGDRTFKIGICGGIAAAKDLLESGEFDDYDFIEVMACPRGCISGGGHPKLPIKRIPERAKALYNIDGKKGEMNKLSALKNEEAAECYRILEEKNADLKNHIFHTHFSPQVAK